MLRLVAAFSVIKLLVVLVLTGLVAWVLIKPAYWFPGAYNDSGEVGKLQLESLGCVQIWPKSVSEVNAQRRSKGATTTA